MIIGRLHAASLAIAVAGLLSLSFPAPGSAYTDACVIGEKALEMTSGQIDELYEDNSHWRIEGSGAVYDVRKGSGGTPRCIVIIKCKTDVFVTVDAGEWRGSITELKKGQKVSFTGDLKGINRLFYRASDNEYIDVRVDRASVQY